MEELHRSEDELAADVARITASPPDDGTLELIVRRPAENEREVVAEAELDVVEGLVGDMWKRRGSSRTPGRLREPRRPGDDDERPRRRRRRRLAGALAAGR